MKHTKSALTALAAFASLALVACSTPATPAPAGAGSAGASASGAAKGVVTVLTHDSFSLSDDVLATFRTQTGYELKVIKQGDGGSLVNQLVLTKDAPLADAVFGVDNTFAGRAIGAGVLAPYASPNLPADSADLKADASDALTPTDFGDVCVNADKAWFAAKKLALPVTLDDLTKPEYKNLLVVEDAASSTPGLAFLVGTVGAKTAGGYLDYWGLLKDNGVKVVKDWSAAYYTEFSGGGKGGTRPLVVSYASSPAATVSADGASSSTVSLNETCFRQVEYAGVLAGAKNVAGAQAFVDWLLSAPVQADIPGQMYMYPAVKATKLPAEWATFAPLPSRPFAVPAADISTNRDAWIKAWTAKVIG
mgnify:CR=1 FL=1